MNKYLSSKIRIVSFISIIMVVYVHCYNFHDSCLDITTTITEGLNYGTFIEYFICNGFNRVSVPLFFIISGYLFFLTHDFTVSKYLYKVKSRFVTLVIPYIVWSLMGILLFFLFRNLDVQPVKDTMGILNTQGILPLLWEPPSFQMWYVKQLFIYVLISPLFYIILKRNFTSIIYFAGVFYIWFIDMDCGLIRTEGLLFFALGAYLAINKKQQIILRHANKKGILTLFVLWITLLVIKTIISGLGIDGIGPKAIYRIAELIGIYVTWYGLDYILKDGFIKEKVLALSSYTFFIFCFHEPVLNLIMNYSLIYINSTLGRLLTYFIYSNGGILCALFIGSLIRRYIPEVYNLLCGSRGSKKRNLEINEGIKFNCSNK